MREIEVLSTSGKHIVVDQDGDELCTFISVPGATFTFGLSLEQAGELATAYARLVEDRRRELAGVAP
jgi:hypothetical protein